MLPVKTPLAGRNAPEKFAPEDRGANLNSADNSTSAENEFGRIMDRTKSSETRADQHLQNDRPTRTAKNHKPLKAEPIPEEAVTGQEIFSKTDEAISKISCQTIQPEVRVQSDAIKTIVNESTSPIIVPPPPVPVLITLPLAAAFVSGSEIAATNKADPDAQLLSGKNISAPLSQTLTPATVGQPAGNALTPSPAASVTGSATASVSPDDAGKIVETMTPILPMGLKPGPGERPVADRSAAKDVAAEKTAVMTGATGSQSKMAAALSPSATDTASANSINVPTSSDNDHKPKSSEASANGEILPATIIPAATSKQLSNNSGTGVATDAGVMKKAEKPTEVAGLGEKVLPGGKVDPSPAPQLRPAAVSALNSESLKPDVSISFSTTSFGTPVMTELADAATLPSLAETQLRTLERTAEMMTFHVTRLAKSDMETMQVVIRPGAGTELSLELRQRNGEVEVHAVLQRGDHQVLNQYWPELQERLEQRGIKLSSLGGETNSFSNGNGNFSRQQNSPREEVAQQASAFAEFTMAMNRGGATARLATTTPGANEWWA